MTTPPPNLAAHPEVTVNPAASPAEPPAAVSVPRPAVSRGRAAAFVAAVAVMGLLPLGLGVVEPPGLPPIPGMAWTLALDERSAKAAAAIARPKVMFVGGSNVRFGVDAAGLTADLGVPVVNYGLHATLGADVIAERAAAVIKPGDAVVFAPELSHFRKGSGDDSSDDLRLTFLLAHPSPTIDRRQMSAAALAWRLSRSRCNRLRALIDAAATKAVDRVLGYVPPPLTTMYTPAGVGPDGAVVFPRPAPLPADQWAISKPPANVAAMSMSPTGSRGGAGFQRLLQACHDRGATLYVMPPLRVTTDRLDQRTLAAEERAWLDYAVAHGAKPILLGGANLLPVTDGYDTDYHLNDVGEAAARVRLAAALRPVVAGMR